MGYEPALELKMQRLFATLSEKDRRRYAGIEAAKLGHGGIDVHFGVIRDGSEDGATGLAGT